MCPLQHGSIFLYGVDLLGGQRDLMSRSHAVRMTAPVVLRFLSFFLPIFFEQARLHVSLVSFRGLLVPQVPGRRPSS